MSTKCTLYYDQNHHFYAECGDEDHVYLEIENDSVSTTLRLDLEQMVGLVNQFDLNELRRQAELTDEQIRAHVEATVNARYQSKDFLSQLAGSLVYGCANDPKEKQIAAAMEFYTHKRDYLKRLIPVLENKPRKGSRFMYGLEEVS